jgi:methylenetetrahydrofolate reductase (NADPH)
VTVPIIPGLKILTSKNQLTSIPRNFYVDVPQELADEVEAASPERVKEIGVEWAHRQVEELLARGVPSVHFYVMQSAAAIKCLMAKLKL